MYGLVKKRSNGPDREVIYKRTAETSNLSKAKRFNEMERQKCVYKVEKLNNETTKNLSRYTGMFHEVKKYYDELKRSEVKYVDTEVLSQIFSKDSLLGSYFSTSEENLTISDTPRLEITKLEKEQRKNNS